MKYGNLSFGRSNVTHNSEITYELFKEVKNVYVNLKIELIWKWFINIFLSYLSCIWFLNKKLQKQSYLRKISTCA